MIKFHEFSRFQDSHFSIITKFHDFPQISRCNFFLMWSTHPFDPLMSLVGEDSDLKSTEPWFSSFEISFQISNILVKV